MPIRKISHARVRVDDVSSALDFHHSVMGLIEVGRDGGEIFMGSGVDGYHDISLIEGGTGVAMFAFAVNNSDDLVRIERALSDAGAAWERLSDAGPGIGNALQFTLPSGHAMQFVLRGEGIHYTHPAQPYQRMAPGSGPFGLDHITLRAEGALEKTTAFLRDVLGFMMSDVMVTNDGSQKGAWMRVGEYHHDLAIIRGAPRETLDHLCWTVSSFDHIKLMLDRLARSGIKVEAGPGRHDIGGNLYAYFWAPGGNRYEFSAEMPRVTNREAPR